MAQLRRKPRTPFPYVLVEDRERKEDEHARFIIAPPTERQWAEVVDDAPGNAAVLSEAVIRFVDRLENHPDAEAFGAAGSKERRAFVDECMGLERIRELGNAVADTMLSERERKN